MAFEPFSQPRLFHPETGKRWIYVHNKPIQIPEECLSRPNCYILHPDQPELALDREIGSAQLSLLPKPKELPTLADKEKVIEALEVRIGQVGAFGCNLTCQLETSEALDNRGEI